jgi:hypothetical protein
MSNIEPNIGRDMLLTHSIISRALLVSIEHVDKFIEDKYPEKLRFNGFLNYLECFSTVLSVHHHLETEEAFPYLKNIITDAPYDLLNEQHTVMQKSLDELNYILSDLKENYIDIESLKHLKTVLNTINGGWYPHIKIESQHFAPAKLGNLINSDEMIILHQKFSKYSRMHSKPDYLIIPFIVYNLSPKVRDMWVQELPEIVVNQLIPHTWKAEWESMKPFLLPI